MYEEFKTLLIIETQIQACNIATNLEKPKVDAKPAEWASKKEFTDKMIWEVIEKDVMRTR